MSSGITQFESKPTKNNDRAVDRALSPKQIPTQTVTDRKSQMW